MPEIKYQHLCSSCRGIGSFVMPSEGRLIDVSCMICDGTGQTDKKQIGEIDRKELPKFSGN